MVLASDFYRMLLSLGLLLLTLEGELVAANGQQGIKVLQMWAATSIINNLTHRCLYGADGCDLTQRQLCGL